MRVLEHYSKPSKSMKKSTLKIANFQDLDIFCYVIRVGKFSHCVFEFRLSHTYSIFEFSSEKSCLNLKNGMVWSECPF